MNILAFSKLLINLVVQDNPNVLIEKDSERMGRFEYMNGVCFLQRVC